MIDSLSIANIHTPYEARSDIASQLDNTLLLKKDILNLIVEKLTV
jgi:hypothetical protein